MGWEPPIVYVYAVMAVDRLIHAMDYPNQFAPQEVVVQDSPPLDAGDKRIFSNQRRAAILALINGPPPIGPCNSKHP
jgi:hypothetical protein